MKLPAAILAPIAIALVCSLPSAGGERVEAPAVFEFSEPVLLLSLDGASVELVFDAQSEGEVPTNGGIWLGTSASDHPAPAVDVSSDGETLSLRGPTEVGSSPLTIQGRLLPGQRIEVRGSSLTVTVGGSFAPLSSESGRAATAADTAPADDGETENGPPSEPPPLVTIQVAESQVFGSGLDNVEIEIEDGDLHLEHGTGRLSLVSRSSKLVVETHDGPLRVVAVGGAVTVADQEGALGLALEGADLRLHGGAGPIQGETTETLLLIEGRGGPLELQATSSSLTLSRLREQVLLRGEDLELELDSLVGKVSLELVSSRVGAKSLEGPAELSLDRESILELEGSRNGVSVQARESDLKILSAEGVTTVKLEGGRLDAERVANLELEAVGAAVVVRDVQRLRKAELVDTQFELGLESVSHAPSLAVRGLSDGVVRLLTPCTVSLARRQSETDRQVRISGCELDAPGRRGKAYQRRRLDGGRATKLLLALEGDATVEVEGRP